MNIAKFCNHFYNSTNIPIYCYVDGVLVFSANSDPDHLQLPEKIARRMIREEAAGDIYETEVSSYYGRIRGTGPAELFIAGPVKAEAYTESDLARFFHIYHIPAENREAYQRQFDITGNYALIRFFHLLSGYQEAMGGEETVNAFVSVEKNEDLAEFQASRFEKYDDDIKVNIMEASRRFAPYIKEGNIEGLVAESARGQDFYLGEYCADKKNNQLVVMIISLTLAYELAVEGGMPEKEGYLLLRNYISQAFGAKTAAEVDEISMKATMNLVGYMRNYLDRGIRHSSVYDCIQYIRENVYAPVTVKEVAEYAGYSEEYFSRLFKKEMGFGASEFIFNCKLLEARNLLKSTKKSIGEISEMLCFSSQSHLQRRFKEKYGMTPKEYREKGDV